MRWGIVGHGSIAKTFMEAARGIGHSIEMVVGRDSGRIEDFCSSYDVPEGSTDLLSLVSAVDAAYIAVPHSGHCSSTVPLLEASVPVLCEKPLAVNEAEVSKMIRTAESTQTFLMEAMWTRHLPVYEKVLSWINEGKIGEVVLVEASFGFNAPYVPESRLWNPDLAGGSLLDVGIYTLTLADLIYGSPPEEFSAKAELSPEGIDKHLGVVAKYPNGGLARLGSAINAALGFSGRVIGSEGMIEIPFFWQAEKAVLTSNSLSEDISIPHDVNGFEYQIREVQRCLESGAVESDVVPWSWSLSMSRLMDEIRSEIGVIYPADKESENG